MTKKFNAFTLAEVLITLGIIGVVAAMTMPTLINQTNGAQYKAAYKKALSAISQAITLNVALDDISFAEIDNSTYKLDSVLSSRMNVVKNTSAAGYDLPTSISASYKYTCTQADKDASVEGCTAAGTELSKSATFSGDSALNKFLFFNDSSMFAYKDSSAVNCKGANVCFGIIDVNGAKGPNKVVSNAESPTDIYPVVFFDQTILPASDVASAVLYSK